MALLNDRTTVDTYDLCKGILTKSIKKKPKVAPLGR